MNQPSNKESPSLENILNDPELADLRQAYREHQHFENSKTLSEAKQRMGKRIKQFLAESDDEDEEQ